MVKNLEVGRQDHEGPGKILAHLQGNQARHAPAGTPSGAGSQGGIYGRVSIHGGLMAVLLAGLIVLAAAAILGLSRHR